MRSCVFTKTENHIGKYNMKKILIGIFLSSLVVFALIYAWPLILFEEGTKEYSHTYTFEHSEPSTTGSTLTYIPPATSGNLTLKEWFKYQRGDLTNSTSPYRRMRYYDFTTEGVILLMGFNSTETSKICVLLYNNETTKTINVTDISLTPPITDIVVETSPSIGLIGPQEGASGNFTVSTDDVDPGFYNLTLTLDFTYPSTQGTGILTANLTMMVYNITKYQYPGMEMALWNGDTLNVDLEYSNITWITEEECYLDTAYNLNYTFATPWNGTYPPPEYYIWIPGGSLFGVLAGAATIAAVLIGLGTSSIGTAVAMCGIAAGVATIIDAVWTDTQPSHPEIEYTEEYTQRTEILGDGRIITEEKLRSTLKIWGTSSYRSGQVKATRTTNEAEYEQEYPVPEFPLGSGLIIALAPAIPLVYLWRKRKKTVRK